MEGDGYLIGEPISYQTISIHSLRVEGDDIVVLKAMIHDNFNPLPPCGGRLYNFDHVFCVELFQSTPSVWRETLPQCLDSSCKRYFNPLPPCGGRLSENVLTALITANFNPLPPCGGRRQLPSLRLLRPCHFNPLPPCGGRHDDKSGSEDVAALFQSTPSVWRETAYIIYAMTALSKDFNPLPPCGGRLSAAS